MAKDKKPRSFFSKLVFAIVGAVSLFLCLSGILIALVICADHIAEFFNSWDMQNKWEPFRGYNYFSYIQQLPGALYVAFTHFPEACFLTVIMYPMVVVLFVILEAFDNNYRLLVMGWGPFMTGAILFISCGVSMLRNEENPGAGKFTKL